ncbi:hypothetical protein BGX34_007079 [Mortierella sp. NVP85]|nr:hypothetical protein BGX34_007079 [Mortierella sp. NVP85]
MDEASAIQLLPQQALPELLVSTPIDQQVEVLQQPDKGTPPGEANAGTEPPTPTTTTTETAPSGSAEEQSRPDAESASIPDTNSSSITSTLTNATSISATSFTATATITTTTIECIITPVISADVETVSTEPPKKRRRTKRDATSHQIPASTRELRSRARPKVEAQNRDSIEAVGSDGTKPSPMDMPKPAASSKGTKRVRPDSAQKPAKKRSSKATEGAPMKAADADPEDIEEAKAEKEYEKSILKRGARIFKPVDVGDPARVVNRWADDVGVPIRATSNLIPFPFDDPSLFDKNASAFLFVTLTNVIREEPVSDKESMEIYFIPQRAAGPGHAIDSCFSLSLMNMTLNSPTILAECPEDLRELASRISATDTASAAWRIFDTSSVGEKVHRVHEMVHLLGDWSQEPARPEFDKRSYAVRRREQQKMDAEDETPSATKGTKKRLKSGPVKGGKSESSPPVANEALKDEKEDVEEDVEHHITVFLPINGAVWEIDSMMPEPRKIGLVGEGDWQLEVGRYLGSMKDTISHVAKAPQLTYAAAIYRKDS